MEILLFSAAGTVTVFAFQFVEFVCGEGSEDLGSRRRTFARRMSNGVRTLTLTMPVSIAYRG